MIPIFKNEAFWFALSAVNVVSFMVCTVFNNPEGVVFSALGFASCIVTIWANRAIDSQE